MADVVTVEMICGGCEGITTSTSLSKGKDDTKSTQNQNAKYLLGWGSIMRGMERRGS
jgi:hypothetical protein